MRQEEREKQGGLEGGQGGWAQTLAVWESGKHKSVVTPGFGLRILTDAGAAHPSRGSKGFMMGKGVVGVHFQCVDFLHARLPKSFWN